MREDNTPPGPQRDRGDLIERLRTLSGEVSGAFGDLGTLLPYAVAAIGAGLLAPGPVFLGFAAGYLMVAIVYRCPVSVQPMKALGAVIIAGGLSGPEIAWAGVVIGAVLMALSMTSVLQKAARAVPQSVVTGLQAGLGLMLAAVAFGLMGQNWPLALPVVAVLSLSYVWPRGPWALLVVVGGALFLPATGGMGLLETSSIGRADDMRHVFSGVLAQLPLTLLNAVVVAAAVARASFPVAARTVSEQKLAATSGLLNMVCAPLGAMPMCHGAGGIAAHHRFGARGMGAPLLLAAGCLAAAVAGPRMIDVLAAIPAPVVGALLAYAAADLIFSKRMFDARWDCRPVIGAAAIGTFMAGALVGLIAGLAAETLRVQIVRRARAGRDGRAG
ncbi:molybdate transporter family protein [Pseudoruegeria sp. HB172150]|uniref:molybdate transporter family protein n=1 Tax=Pseudoruegeria sp. HB172150 TaxID=2721164 RepID=UPI0015541D02|nr:molybdate transporter family protein [Pseudoruegeria sp. HB172150]